MPAFRQARDLGLDGVELDVRRTVDGALVVIHEPYLPDGAPVADTPMGDLPAWVPTLDEALEACAGLTLVNVEIKNSPIEPGFDAVHRVAAQVAAVISGRLGILVSSFNLATLDAFRSAAPEVPTGWLTGSGWDQMGAVAQAAAGGHTALNPADDAVTEALIDAAHAARLQVMVWTVDDPARMVALSVARADVIITDRPVLARATLRGPFP